LGALAALASEVNAPDFIGEVRGTPPVMPKGVLDAQSVSAVIASLQRENCIVMDEVLSVGVPYFDASKHSPRFSHLMLTGGAIGQGPSAATGAAYHILEVELLRAGVAQTGPVTRSMLGLDNPFLNWVKIGEGFGVPAVAVDRAEALARELERALMDKGPRLIEAIMA
jgi:acetolactate synthase I/II/III large subunit